MQISRASEVTKRVFGQVSEINGYICRYVVSGHIGPQQHVVTTSFLWLVGQVGSGVRCRGVGSRGFAD